MSSELMRSAPAFAKINVGLVVGPLRADGKHEVATVLVRLDLHDTVEVRATRAPGVVVAGFDDTIVGDALSELSHRVGEARGWEARIEKRVPVAAGLGGGSSDAATALRLANELCGTPLPRSRLRALAAELGSDVPFFLEEGPMLATGHGSELEPVALPLDVWVVLVLPAGVTKASTEAVYAAFDARSGAEGFTERRAALLHGLGEVRTATDLVILPGNDLASSAVAGELCALGALRADVSGAGPAVYGLFADRALAEHAASELSSRGKTWVVRPVGASRPSPGSNR